MCMCVCMRACACVRVHLCVFVCMYVSMRCVYDGVCALFCGQITGDMKLTWSGHTRSSP